MDQTLTVWETQTVREAVHLKKKKTVSCLLCDFCDYLRFYLLDQTNVEGWKWKRLAI